MDLLLMVEVDMRRAEGTDKRVWNGTDLNRARCIGNFV